MEGNMDVTHPLLAAWYCPYTPHFIFMIENSPRKKKRKEKKIHPGSYQSKTF